MKIAIASLGKDINSEISFQAGRAPFYLVFEDGELVEIWKNVFSIGGGGAGLAVAKIMSDKKVEKVISGKIGEKMEIALNAKKIEFKEKMGVVKDCL